MRRLLQSEFVCHSINTYGDPSAGGSTAHRPGSPAGGCRDGDGKQNVQALFLTPGGRIFHTASGYRGPVGLKRELDFALGLYRSMRKRPQQAGAIARQAHLARFKASGFRQSDLQRGFVMPTFSLDPRAMQSFARTMARGGRNSELADLRFGINYPLMPIGTFLRNPRVLVGNEVSAFSSVGNIR